MASTTSQVTAIYNDLTKKYTSQYDSLQHQAVSFGTTVANFSLKYSQLSAPHTNKNSLTSELKTTNLQKIQKVFEGRKKTLQESLALQKEIEDGLKEISFPSPPAETLQHIEMLDSSACYVIKKIDESRKGWIEDLNEKLGAIKIITDEMQKHFFKINSWHEKLSKLLKPYDEVISDGLPKPRYPSEQVLKIQESDMSELLIFIEGVTDNLEKSTLSVGKDSSKKINTPTEQIIEEFQDLTT